MEKINEFTILHVKMTGFKRFEETFETELNWTTYISGDNEQGKSTIADAIAYAFCGVPFWGEQSSERLLNQNQKSMCVEVTFVDENGEVHHLLRRKSGNTTTVTLDTLPIRQADITSKFAEKDVFLSILNPLYFIERVAGDGREFLQKLLAPVPHDKVLNELSKSTAELLSEESLLDPEYYIKSRREEKRELEADALYRSGQLDLLETQLRENADKAQTYQSEIAQAKTKIAMMEEKQFSGIDVEKLKQERESVIKALSGEERNQLIQKRLEIEGRTYVSKLTDEIAKIKAELQGLYTQHKRLVDTINLMKIGSRCPTCLQQVTEENHNQVVRGLNAELAKIIADGKQMKSNLTELMELDQKCEKQFLKFREEDLSKVNAQLSEIGDYDLSDISLLDDTLKYGNFSEDQWCELSALQADLKCYETELVSLMKPDEIRTEIEKLKQTCKADETEMLRLNNLIHAATEYAAKRAELSLRQLKMNKAAIRLYDVAKTTGELKNVFRFTYDGKDYRWLSTSQQVKAGLEVANLLRSLTGKNYPTFIDNAECITTSLSRPAGQTIFAYARKGNLTVKTAPQAATKEAA